MKIILFFILFNIFYSQDTLKYSQTLANTGNEFIDITTQTISKPLKWGAEEFETLGYVIAGASILYIFDDKISSAMKRNRSKTLNSIERFGDFYGKPSTALYLTGSIVALGALTQDKWIYDTSMLLSSTLATSGFFQFALTRTTGRSRPEENKGKNDFNFFSFAKKEHSFPSGHTTIAFSTSLVFAHMSDNDWVKYGFYSFAGITALSRVYDQAHFASDVFVSFALTYAVFKSNVYIYENRTKKTSISVFPSSNGVTLSINF